MVPSGGKMKIKCEHREYIGWLITLYVISDRKLFINSDNYINFKIHIGNSIYVILHLLLYCYSDSEWQCFLMSFVSFSLLHPIKVTILLPEKDTAA